MGRTKALTAGATLGLLLALALAGDNIRQDQALVGYISKDRVVELATAADGSVASFTPSPAALASLAALVDPVAIRMFLLASRPADLKPAAAIGRTAEAAANPALSVEFVAVAEDLSEPAAVLAENGVTRAPEIIVYWMGAEVGRLQPAPGAVVEEDLASFIFQVRTQIAGEMLLDNEFFKYTYHKDLLELDCKRCHGPETASRGSCPPSPRLTDA